MGLRGSKLQIPRNVLVYNIYIILAGGTLIFDLYINKI